MGLLSKLFGLNTPTFTERVFLEAEVKRDDLIKQTRGCVAEGRYPLIVYHFRDTRSILREALNAARISYEEARSFEGLRLGDVAEWRQRGDALLFNASILPERVRRGEFKRGGPAPRERVQVHLAERYPTPARDQRVLNLSEILPMPVDFLAFSALDEPLMEAFGGPKMRGMMDQLGLARDECISHSMVTRALLKAQARLGQKAASDHEAPNAEAWFERNMPGRALR